MERVSRSLGISESQTDIREESVMDGGVRMPYPMVTAKRDLAGEACILSIHSMIARTLPDLGTHCRRVADLVFRTAMCLGADGTEEMCNAALVHDVGKLFIDPAILEKRSALFPRERIQIDLHSVIGYMYLRTRDVPDSTAQMVLLHHGYKKETCGHADGKSPNLGADIIRVCDIYDAVTNDRPYHKAVSPGEAIEILSAQPEPLSEEILRAVRMSI